MPVTLQNQENNVPLNLNLLHMHIKVDLI